VLLFLLFGVLLPAGTLLWFMNEAATSQADAARRSLIEAYRSQLPLLRERVGAFWQARLSALDAQAGAGTATDFQRTVTLGLADSIIYLDRRGMPSYPAPIRLLQPDPMANQLDWLRAQIAERARNWADAARMYTTIAQTAKEPSRIARAAQGQIRCLLRSGENEAALRAIQTWFLGGPATPGMDLEGRLIAADERLLALRLMKPGERRYQAALRQFLTLLNDYRVPIPAAQRLFLMHQLSPESAYPTAPAEQFAAEFLEAETAHTADQGLALSRKANTWKLSSQSGHYVALYRMETVNRLMRQALGEQSSSVRFAMIPPGSTAPNESIAAGALLPGWQIGFSLTDSSQLDAVARRRRQSYLWFGYLVIAALTISGLLAWQALRRQLRLTSLKTDLVSAVSHELKTPLASMRLLVDSLLEDEPLDPPKTRDYLRLIAGENQRLARLIENFLTFSRLERNRQRFQFAEVRAEEVVRSAVEVVREHFAGYDLEVDVGPDLPAIQADRDALVTALLNLLDNAYKYTPGVKRVGLRSFRDAGDLVFAVQDNGIGIAPREQKRIFHKFYQVDRRLARETGGVGLGLSIVDFIVRAHGGKVAVKSQPGAGSTFSIRLPFRNGAARNAA
jgi:signal transduction histidine kinase